MAPPQELTIDRPPPAKASLARKAHQPCHEPCCRDTLIFTGDEAAPTVRQGGSWFSFADVLGSTLHPPPTAAGGKFELQEDAPSSGPAAHMFGAVARAELAFAGMGFNFTDPRGEFDASGYAGITFRARSGESSSLKLRVSIPDANTDPDGGICSECENHFGATLDLEPEWNQYTLEFASLRQEPGWGAPRPTRLLTSHLYGVVFRVTEPGSFEAWVDDVRFVRCPGR